jgi:hypothetical protein
MVHGVETVQGAAGCGVSGGGGELTRAGVMDGMVGL